MIHLIIPIIKTPWILLGNSFMEEGNSINRDMEERGWRLRRNQKKKIIDITCTIPNTHHKLLMGTKCPQVWPN